MLVLEAFNTSACNTARSILRNLFNCSHGLASHELEEVHLLSQRHVLDDRMAACGILHPATLGSVRCDGRLIAGIGGAEVERSKFSFLIIMSLMTSGVSMHH